MELQGEKHKHYNKFTDSQCDLSYAIFSVSVSISVKPLTFDPNNNINNSQGEHSQLLLKLLTKTVIHVDQYHIRTAMKCCSHKYNGNETYIAKFISFRFKFCPFPFCFCISYFFSCFPFH